MAPTILQYYYLKGLAVATVITTLPAATNWYIIFKDTLVFIFQYDIHTRLGMMEITPLSSLFVLKYFETLNLFIDCQVQPRRQYELYHPIFSCLSCLQMFEWVFKRDWFDRFVTFRNCRPIVSDADNIVDANNIVVLSKLTWRTI